MLKLTATCVHRKTIKHCDHTGRKLTEEEFEKVNGSKLLGRIQLEIWSERLALVQTVVPAWNGKEGIQIGRPDGCTLGDELLEIAQEAALKAMRTSGTVEVAL